MTTAGEATVPTRTCRSCGVEVWRLIHPMTGRYAPIEVRTSDNANIVVDLVAATYRLVPPGSGQHVSHFATCPQARQWRAGEAAFSEPG